LETPTTQGVKGVAPSLRLGARVGVRGGGGGGVGVGGERAADAVAEEDGGGHGVDGVDGVQPVRRVGEERQPRQCEERVATAARRGEGTGHR